MADNASVKADSASAGKIVHPDPNSAVAGAGLTVEAKLVPVSD